MSRPTSLVALWQHRAAPLVGWQSDLRSMKNCAAAWDRTRRQKVVNDQRIAVQVRVISRNGQIQERSGLRNREGFRIWIKVIRTWIKMNGSSTSPTTNLEYTNVRRCQRENPEGNMSCKATMARSTEELRLEDLEVKGCGDGRCVGAWRLSVPAASRPINLAVSICWPNCPDDSTWQPPLAWYLYGVTPIVTQ